MRQFRHDTAFRRREDAGVLEMLLKFFAEFRGARRRVPDLAAAYGLLERNEIAAAAQRAEALMRTQGRAPEVRLYAARVAYRAEQFERAMALLAPLAASPQAETTVLQLYATCCARAGRPQDGRSALRRALQQAFAIPGEDEVTVLMALIAMAWEAPADRWMHGRQMFSQYGWLLEDAGILAADADRILGACAARDPVRLPGGADAQAVDATLRLLRFSNGAGPDWLEAVMSRVALPWMRRAADADRYGLALMLETQAYGAYVISQESEQHFSRAFAGWTDFMRAAGRRAGAQCAPLARRAQAAPPRVGFFLHSGSMLAHTRVVFEFIDALRAVEPRPLEAVIFHRGKASAEFEQRVAALGVACYGLAGHGGDGEDYASLLALRQRVAEQNVTAIVWVSVATHMAFAFAMRIAPVQIWWALKYHSLEFPEIDGALTAASAGATKRVAGKLWRSAPLAAADWFRAELAAPAARLRARYAQHDLLFACLGREEKLNSAPFLEAVAEILRSCPRAGFLWTGRERLASVDERLAALGVADRCHYIGWVDTKLYAQVIDVFLDSFPFPCAFTLYETMAAGKPVVVYASPESAETGLNGMLGPLLAGESGTPEEQARARDIFAGAPQPLYLCANDAPEYVAFARSLAADANLRRAAGEANRTFVREFLTDRGRMAHTVAVHLLELIAEAGRPR
jgi:hypothetical protein